MPHVLVGDVADPARRATTECPFDCLARTGITGAESHIRTVFDGSLESSSLPCISGGPA